MKMASNAGTSNKQLGKAGEDIAAAYLTNLGYQILKLNYRARHAEIDIVCHDPSASDLVFVEVKTRTSKVHGSPIESITQKKIGFIKRAAQQYLDELEEEEQNCRFDVIGILFTAGVPEIVHLKDVVDH